jgi:hypothetical protein
VRDRHIVEQDKFRTLPARKTWLTAPTEKALELHRPLENGLLKIVLIGEQKEAVL